MSWLVTLAARVAATPAVARAIQALLAAAVAATLAHIAGPVEASAAAAPLLLKPFEW